MDYPALKMGFLWIVVQAAIRVSHDENSELVSEQENMSVTDHVQSVEHLTRKSGVLGSIPGLATYFRFSFRFFKKGSCQLLAKVCARSTG